MKTNRSISSTLNRAAARLGVFMGMACLLVASNSIASPTVTTLAGGNPNINPKYQGYKDGGTLTNALFRTPMGLALDEYYGFLFIADRDNNAVRVNDLILLDTYTFAPTNLTKTPVGVAVDSAGDVFVLNRGSTNAFSTNGSIIMFDTYGDLLMTNATQITNAAGIALDPAGNIYFTSRSNTLSKIALNGTISVIATIPTPGTSLQGLVVKHNGLIAVVDSGRSGIYLIDPVSGIVTTNSGFKGAGDGTGVNNHGILAANAMFRNPTGITEAGDGSLIITDTGNNRVKVINAAGVVTNLYGVTSNFWAGTFPGWFDGVVKYPERITPNVQSRMPVGIVFANDGRLYTSEDFYHTIRMVSNTGLPLPPPLPAQVPSPQIGYVDFPATSSPVYTSVFHPVSSFVFNNDALIVIVGTAGSQTFYNNVNTSNLGLVPDPTTSSPSAPVGYQNGLTQGQVALYTVAGIAPFVSIKAMSAKNDGSPNSGIAQATFQFITANPNIIGNNAAQFTLSDITTNAQIYYTIDGSDPTNDGSGTSILAGAGGILSLNINTNTVFKARAFRQNYQPSGIVSTSFSPSNFVANIISFGFPSGEASSDFVASPGQTFYAPVTLSALPATKIYSLQFNITVTNAGPNPGPALVANSFRFESMLEKPDPDNVGYYLTIPTLSYVAPGLLPPPNAGSLIYNGDWYQNLLSTNTSLNLLTVGWLERATKTNLYNTKLQDLITYSQAHDVLHSSSDGLVELGGYAFAVPINAAPNQTYQIQIGRPSATSDGIGAPGSAVYISAPTNGSYTAGSLNAIKIVTVGQRKYAVGDVYPFRWFNAGDFGDINLNNADVEQVFQSAVYGLNTPPFGSDFFDAMDSCGRFGALNNATGYYTNSSTTLTLSQQNNMFNGNDTTINQVIFGNGQLDICDVYVTYRRSLDPSLAWYQRYWTNGVRVASAIPNVTPNVQSKTTLKAKATTQLSAETAQVNFYAGDVQGTAGQTLQIPISAKIFGNFPLRLLLLNLTVQPVDGSPSLTTPVQFTPNAALGAPSIAVSVGNGNYSAVWLNNAINGLSGSNNIGTLTVRLPANASAQSAYVIHFGHASASPNGIGSFPKQIFHGLITLASHTNSSFGDGIPDSWRMRWFGSVNNYLTSSNADACGDGISNWQKFIAGTDPTLPNSYPKLNSKAVPGGYTSAIHWPTVAGKKYAIERATSLYSGAWSAITTNTGTGTDMEFDDTTGSAVKFYRVRIVQ